MSSEQSAEQPSEESAEVRGGWRDVELAWARTQLHVETDGPEGVWQSLQRCGFLPDGAQIAALEILAGTDLLECSPATAGYRRLTHRRALERDVECFAGAYVELPPVDRASRWRDLRGRCEGFPGLTLRLDRLQPGLQVEWPASARLDEDVRRVLDAIRELFPAAVALLGLARRQMVEQITEADSNLGQTLRTVRESYPELARLAPTFLKSLAARPMTPKEAERLTLKIRKSAARVARESANRRRYAGLALVLFLCGMAFRLAVLPFRASPETAGKNGPTAAEVWETVLQARAARIRQYGVEPLVKDQARYGIAMYKILGPGPHDIVWEQDLIEMGFDSAKLLPPPMSEFLAVPVDGGAPFKVRTTPDGYERISPSTPGGENE